METYHPVPAHGIFAEVILPLAVPKPYTYAVPEELVAAVCPGLRVEVEFGGNKRYAGLVSRLHHEVPAHKFKSILSVIDEEPVLNEKTLQFWHWLAEYYCCSLGEVMEAALPANLKLASERRLVLSPLYDGSFTGLNDKEYLIAEALSIQETITIDDVRKILNQKTIYQVIKGLLDKKVIYLYEEMEEKYAPKKVSCVRLAEPYRSEPKQLAQAFNLVAKAQRQTEALMAFIQLTREQPSKDGGILRSELYKKASVDSSVLNSLAKKGIFELYEREVSRLGGYEDEVTEADELAPQQTRALEEIGNHFTEEKNTVLLHGVTGSGKTRVYLELMQKAMARGEQVLYLLPEVALTTQIISRLQKTLGDAVTVYHHRITNNERVEIWNKVRQFDSGENSSTVRQLAVGSQTVAAATDCQLPTEEELPTCILGARSALFLPFTNLGLVIVDEEHDTSYKQNDPAPRYQGRDAAIYLAHLHGAKVVLGTATPSLETYHNARSGKYGLVEMTERFGGIQMPEIVVVDAKLEAKQRKLQGHFTSVLVEELKTALAKGEQAILFQNRRGYAPTLRCNTCGWHSECIHCDVSLTYHKFRNNLQCHYCGYQQELAKTCPACGSHELNLQGFGTQKIEDELKIYLPDANIGRMDYDTVRTKDAHARIINDFEERRLDILVGTQMVTKGLDFENVSIVGVVSADQLLQFPDFRSGERGFQLITQVAGRAGRRDKRGKVIVQAMNTSHPVIKEVIDNDFQEFYEREIMERKAFEYPPFSRLIKITLKHKKPDVLNRGSKYFVQVLKSKLGKRLLGPTVPSVGRVREYYLLDILIKMERNPNLWKLTKDLIGEATRVMQQTEGFSTVRVNVDVDPG
ncbi:MAG: primosomal protein N' [Saprospiraceae bacterium]|nr:primosomal protein N' [Saprospiraceae bacterium]MCF8252227.1 primosomal protein N' [Saprospiraceae bacterium]MCF8283271.1 primosomal protein N' [Bacteroidales bacterium]MCF8313893.1 primosomal protein N' [Saprospiraceae bacterium]MCF8443272.1 primosomal protein N' [Saprospiraceae bacterium]